MENTTYRTGEAPKVGDTVRLHDTTGIDYYSTLKNKNTVVTGVVNGSSSLLLSVKDGASQYKVSRFNLVERSKLAADEPVKGPVRFRIINAAGQNIANASTLENLQTRLQTLLLENPGKSFDVYQYLSTAAAKLPEVQFVDRRAAVETPQPVEQKNIISSEQMFTKR